MGALTLEMIDLRPGPLNDRSWRPPFDEAVNCTNPHWWNPLFYDIEHPWYVQMLEAGAEVARVELKEDVDIEHYANVPAIGSERLEIAFIEVATSEYESGVGPQVVRALERRHREQADGGALAPRDHVHAHSDTVVLANL